MVARSVLALAFCIEAAVVTERDHGWELEPESEENLSGRAASPGTNGDGTSLDAFDLSATSASTKLELGGETARGAGSFCIE